MAGGTSGKSTALYLVALAKIEAAKQAIQQISQAGGVVGDPRHAAVSDPAISAAITALQAIQ